MSDSADAPALAEVATPVNPRGSASKRPPAGGHGSAKRRNFFLALIFLAPALLLIGALLVYPVVFTVIRSLFDQTGKEFIGWENYLTMFSKDSTFMAIRNNVIWVIVAPITCTILGLVFAVLMEKIRWATAFKLIVFMPMAISMLAAGVIFRGMFQEDPQMGVVNAAIVGVNKVISGEAASFPGAKPRGEMGITDEQGTIISDDVLEPGTEQNFPLVGIRADDLPEGLQQAVPGAEPADDQITGTVWLDVIRGGGGTNGEIDEGKSGLGGLRVDAVDADGQIIASATTDDDGTFVLEGLDPGDYRIALPATNFDAGTQGVSWLSSSFITAVIILSYIWIWAGFAMVMISSGLSAMDRTLQEAARVDGANEWRVFTKITVPVLSPVIIVVLVTLIINVLKIFDLVYVIPPGSSQAAANVIAVEMWRVSFGGGNNQGLGSALAVLLLVLVLPSMIINIRRFREERG